MALKSEIDNIISEIERNLENYGTKKELLIKGNYIQMYFPFQTALDLL